MTSLTVVFPHPKLTPLSATDPPNALMIQLLRKELYANAAAITSRQGGGAHGHLGLIMPAAECNAIPAVGVANAWADPLNPGALHIAGGTTAQVANVAAAHEQNAKNFNTFITVREALKAQILEAAPNACLNTLADPILGFTNVTPSQMLAHLRATHGAITTEDLEANEKKLSTPWDPNTPTEHIIDGVTKVRAFAHAQEPIAEGKAIRTVLKVFEDSGILADAVKDWKKKPMAQQMLVNMRGHFRIYNNRRIRDQATSSQQGHGTAANATNQDTSNELLALLNQAIQCQPAGNPITTQIQTLLANAATTNNGGTTNPPPNPSGTNNHCCCWTHGLSRNPNHTSATCDRPAEGHQTSNTLKWALNLVFQTLNVAPVRVTTS